MNAGVDKTFINSYEFSLTFSIIDLFDNLREIQYSEDIIEKNRSSINYEKNSNISILANNGSDELIKKEDENLFNEGLMPELTADTPTSTNLKTVEQKAFVFPIEDTQEKQIPIKPLNKFAERRDIVNKNIVRALRHHFWTEITSTTDPKVFGKTKHSHTFMDSVKNYGSTVSLVAELDEELKDRVSFLIGVIATGNFYYPNPSPSQTKIINMFRGLVRSYTAKNYYNFGEMKETQALMTILKETKKIDEIIAGYPIMAASTAIYFDAFEKIINYRKRE